MRTRKVEAVARDINELKSKKAMLQKRKHKHKIEEVVKVTDAKIRLEKKRKEF